MCPWSLHLPVDSCISYNMEGGADIFPLMVLTFLTFIIYFFYSSPRVAYSQENDTLMQSSKNGVAGTVIGEFGGMSKKGYAPYNMKKENQE